MKILSDKKNSQHRQQTSQAASGTVHSQQSAASGKTSRRFVYDVDKNQPKALLLHALSASKKSFMLPTQKAFIESIIAVGLGGQSLKDAARTFGVDVSALSSMLQDLSKNDPPAVLKRVLEYAQHLERGTGTQPVAPVNDAFEAATAPAPVFAAAGVQQFVVSPQIQQKATLLVGFATAKRETTPDDKRALFDAIKAIAMSNKSVMDAAKWFDVRDDAVVQALSAVDKLPTEPAFARILSMPDASIHAAEPHLLVGGVASETATQVSAQVSTHRSQTPLAAPMPPAKKPRRKDSKQGAQKLSPLASHSISTPSPSPQVGVRASEHDAEIAAAFFNTPNSLSPNDDANLRLLPASMDPQLLQAKEPQLLVESPLVPSQHFPENLEPEETNVPRMLYGIVAGNKQRPIAITPQLIQTAHAGFQNAAAVLSPSVAPSKIAIFEAMIDVCQYGYSPAAATARSVPQETLKAAMSALYATTPTQMFQWLSSDKGDGADALPGIVLPLDVSHRF